MVVSCFFTLMSRPQHVFMSHFFLSGKTGGKDLKLIQKEMRDVIRQITACVTFLPLLDCVCE